MKSNRLFRSLSAACLLAVAHLGLTAAVVTLPAAPARAQVGDPNHFQPQYNDFAGIVIFGFDSGPIYQDLIGMSLKSWASYDSYASYTDPPDHSPTRNRDWDLVHVGYYRKIRYYDANYQLVTTFDDPTEHGIYEGFSNTDDDWVSAGVEAVPLNSGIQVQYPSVRYCTSQYKFHVARRSWDSGLVQPVGDYPVWSPDGFNMTGWETGEGPFRQLTLPPDGDPNGPTGS